MRAPRNRCIIFRKTKFRPPEASYPSWPAFEPPWDDPFTDHTQRILTISPGAGNTEAANTGSRSPTKRKDAKSGRRSSRVRRRSRPEFDFDWLAREVRLSGGKVRNIAVSAAFQAASVDGVIGMGELIEAARRDEKSGQTWRPSDRGA